MAEERKVEKSLEKMITFCVQSRLARELACEAHLLGSPVLAELHVLVPRLGFGLCGHQRAQLLAAVLAGHDQHVRDLPSKS